MVPRCRIIAVASENSYVIFICTFDPFKRGKGCYYFSNLPDAARDFLNYLETGNVDGVFSQQLDSAVEFARHNKKWRAEYMKTLVYNNDLKNEGREEGRIEGALAFIRSSRKMNIPENLILENLINEFKLKESDATDMLLKA